MPIAAEFPARIGLWCGVVPSPAGGFPPAATELSTKGVMNNRTNVKEIMPAELASELRALVAEAEKILSDEGASPTHPAVAALRERFEAAQEQMGALYTDAKAKVVTGAKAADRTIRDHPYQSLAVALGAGVLLGVLIGRRNGS